MNKLINLGITFLFAFSIIIFTSCNEDQANEEDKKENVTEDIAPENLMTINFKVNGMTCAGCEKAIENSIQTLNGINHTKISHLDSNAVIEFDKTKTDEDAIKNAITEAGYKVVE